MIFVDNLEAANVLLALLVVAVALLSVWLWIENARRDVCSRAALHWHTVADYLAREAHYDIEQAANLAEVLAESPAPVMTDAELHHLFTPSARGVR